jgi:hypothetical protein
MGKKTYLRFKRRAHRQDKASYTTLKLGQPLIIVGGVKTGKTKTLETLKAHLEYHKQKVIYIDAMLNLSDILREFEGKNATERQANMLNAVDSETYVIVDNAEKVTDSKKLVVVLWLFEKCRNMVVACNHINGLHWKLKRRLELKGALTEHLGHGGQTFDMTLILVAVLVVFIALTGALELLLGAAALRYLFQGIRVGNNKI